MKEFRVLLVGGRQEDSVERSDGELPLVVEPVQGGEAALRRLHRTPRPNAVVIDQRPGSINAAALADRILTDPALDGMRTVLLTGSPDTVTYGASGGFDAYVVERDRAQGIALALAAVSVLSG